MASLLDVLASNERHGRGDVAIFEVGKGYAADAAGSPAEWWRLGILLAGTAVPGSWSLPGRPWELEDGKALVALVARVLGVAEPIFRPYTGGPPLHPGRAATADAAGAVVGLIGEVHPTTLAERDLRAERVVVAELAIEGLAGGQLAPTRARPLERHPAVERDLALVLREEIAAGSVAQTLRTAGAATLRDIELFDVYRGAPLAAGEKSLAWRLRLQSDDGPLDEAAVETVVGRLVDAVAREHGGRLRA